MGNYSYLLLTRNCSKVGINWEKFSYNEKHYHYTFNIYYGSHLKCRTLLDYSTFLDGKKIYGYFTATNGYPAIFDDVNKCLEWPDDCDSAEMLFSYDNLPMVWKITFKKNASLVVVRTFQLKKVSECSAETYSSVFKELREAKF